MFALSRPCRGGAGRWSPRAAEGVFSLLWLIIALPLLGAAILLLGGKATDRWGHWLGTAMPIGSFVFSLVMFFPLLGRDEESRQIGQHLYDWIQVGQLNVGMDLLYDQLLRCSCSSSPASGP